MTGSTAVSGLAAFEAVMLATAVGFFFIYLGWSCSKRGQRPPPRSRSRRNHP